MSTPGPSDAALYAQREALRDPEADARQRGERSRQREVTAIPRLRAVGNVLLLLIIAIHNWLFLGGVDLELLAQYGALQLVYTVVSTLLLRRFYRDDAKLDLGTLFLAGDVAIFVLAVYVSGGERSWLLPVLCVRVADQVGTSRRRAFAFASLTAALQILLVLYMAWVEQRGLRIEVELAKVFFVYVMNSYLSLAAGPAERQRKETQAATAMARTLITELATRTEQLEVERERAHAASVAKGTFLANISHEIRTPMNAVLGMTELLLEEPLPDAQRKMAQTILTAGKSLLAIVNDVLDMSKVEAGGLRLHVADLDVAHVVETVLSPMRVLADEKSISLTSEVEHLPERGVRGDEMRLRQVLFNLTGNAIKFTQSGGVTVRVRVLAAFDDSLRLRFAVSDTGIGMSAEAAKRVFDAFEQADESTTRKFGGTGLGLTISKKLVALMGGDLVLQTAPGRGSEFSFEIGMPLGTIKPKVQSLRPESENAARLRARNPHVLVAEDTDVNRMLLQRWLERLGCRVSSVENGAQAVTLLTRAHDFDIVFMDWHMPELDGLQATRRIREWEAAQARPRTRIIGFTASAFAEEIERCRQAGMDDVLSKPLVRAQLERKLYEHILGPMDAASAPETSLQSEEPHLDLAVIAELRQLDDGNKSVVRELLGNFLHKAPGRLHELERACESGDAERLRQMAHSLRGSAGGIGAKRLTALATALEFQAAAEPMGDVRTSLQALRRELEHVARALTAVLSELPQAEPRARSGAPTGQHR